MSDRQGEGGQQSKVCGRRTLELLCWTGLFSWRVGDNRLATGVFVPSRQFGTARPSETSVGPGDGASSLAGGEGRGRGVVKGCGHKEPLIQGSTI